MRKKNKSFFTKKNVKKFIKDVGRFINGETPKKLRIYKIGKDGELREVLNKIELDDYSDKNDT